jgi:hypothetical protein
MTDRECLMQIIGSLGLVETHHMRPAENEYRALSDSVRMCEGDECDDFYIEVEFDEDGKANRHGVWE